MGGGAGAGETPETPLKPVVVQTGRDGQLIGLELAGVQWGPWRPIGAVAYGLESGAVRFKAGLGVDWGVELPLPVELQLLRGGKPVRLEGLYAQAMDWFETPVLGREGQTGVEAGFTLGETRYRAFGGRLWPRPDDETGEAGEGPLVAYLAMSESRSWDLPFGLALGLSARSVMGVRLEPFLAQAEPELEPEPDELEGKVEGWERWSFSSAVYTLSVGLDGLELRARGGHLENPAGLPGFEFTTGVRGLAPLKGPAFWNVGLTRRLPVYETRLELPVPPELERWLPSELAITLEGAFRVQMGGVFRPPEPSEGPPEEEGRTLTLGALVDDEEDEEDAEGEGRKGKEPWAHEGLLSWGLSLTLRVQTFTVRVDAVITQEGEAAVRLSF